MGKFDGILLCTDLDDTFLTTDTLICYIIAVNCFYTVSKMKKDFSLNSFFLKGQTILRIRHKILNTIKSRAGLFCGIDFVHIAVFLKQPVQIIVTDFLNISSDRNCNA